MGRKGRENRWEYAGKTYDEVFDEPTLLSIYKLMCDNVVQTMDFPISTGKEGNVYKGTAETGDVALKIYRVATSTYRNMPRYILGDPRFKGVKRNKRSLIYAWAMKEYKNLELMYGAGVRAPKPFGVHHNVLVMEYIKSGEGPAPMMKDVHLTDPEGMFTALLDAVRTLYKKAGLVHGDLSEYNVLINGQGEGVIIDVGQSVMVQHPQSEEFLCRDMKRLVRYFGSLGVPASEKDAWEIVVGDSGGKDGGKEEEACT